MDRDTTIRPRCGSVRYLRRSSKEDGVVIAVHPDRDDWRGIRPDKYREHLSSLEMELSRFKKQVLAAHQARVS